jgi:hypothetical protein
MPSRSNGILFWGELACGLRGEGDVSVEQSQTLGAESAGGQRLIFSSAYYVPGLDAILAAAAPGLKSHTGYWNPADSTDAAPPRFKVIDEIAVKPIWWTPKFDKDGTACFPVWPFAHSGDPPGLGPYSPETWMSWVMLTDGRTVKPGDRSRPLDCQRHGDHGPETVHDVRVVSLDEIFHLAAANSFSQVRLSTVASKGQGIVPHAAYPAVGVLAGIHVISREVDSWTWNTYWWEPDLYRNSGDFANGRPELPSPWNHYVMNASLNAAGDPTADGKARNPLYNPYQESILPADISSFKQMPLGGLASNCLSCHSNASYPPTNHLARAVFTPTSAPRPDFGGALRLGFLWSIANYWEPIF